jgi:hypothetical protein
MGTRMTLIGRIFADFLVEQGLSEFFKGTRLTQIGWMFADFYLNTDSADWTDVRGFFI